jgi:hypothetical protein
MADEPNLGERRGSKGCTRVRKRLATGGAGAGRASAKRRYIRTSNGYPGRFLNKRLLLARRSFAKTDEPAVSLQSFLQTNASSCKPRLADGMRRNAERFNDVGSRDLIAGRFAAVRNPSACLRETLTQVVCTPYCNQRAEEPTGFPRQGILGVPAKSRSDLKAARSPKLSCWTAGSRGLDGAMVRSSGTTRPHPPRSPPARLSHVEGPLVGGARSATRAGVRDGLQARRGRGGRPACGVIEG